MSTGQRVIDFLGDFSVSQEDREYFLTYPWKSGEWYSIETEYCANEVQCEDGDDDLRGMSPEEVLALIQEDDEDAILENGIVVGETFIIIQAE